MDALLAHVDPRIVHPARQYHCQNLMVFPRV
jgi:hypothetical protein